MGALGRIRAVGVEQESVGRWQIEVGIQRFDLSFACGEDLSPEPAQFRLLPLQPAHFSAPHAPGSAKIQSVSNSQRAFIGPVPEVHTPRAPKLAARLFLSIKVT